MERALDAAWSYLMCPALNEPMLAKAVTRGADVIVVDLEDSAPLHLKAEARTIAARATAQLKGCFVVRINDPAMPASRDCAAADIAAVLHPALAGIVIPKVETAEAIERTCAVLDAHRDRIGPGFELIPLIETPAGVEALDRILAGRSPWVGRVGFGAGDYTAVLGVPWSHLPGQLLYPRSRIASVSSALGLSGPIDTGSPLLDDRDTFVNDGMEAKLQGFKAKFAIHPRQVDWIHALFQPTDAELAKAEKVAAAYERLVKEGKAELVTSAEGLMLDPPVVRHSFSILKRAMPA